MHGWILNTRLAICTLRDGKLFNHYGELHSEGKRQLDDKLFETAVFNYIDGSVQSWYLQCVSTTVLVSYQNTALIDGLVLERRNSIANALEFRLSCTNPTKFNLSTRDYNF